MSTGIIEWNVNFTGFMFSSKLVTFFKLKRLSSTKKDVYNFKYLGAWWQVAKNKVPERNLSTVNKLTCMGNDDAKFKIFHWVEKQDNHMEKWIPQSHKVRLVISLPESIFYFHLKLKNWKKGVILYRNYGAASVGEC